MFTFLHSPSMKRADGDEDGGDSESAERPEAKTPASKLGAATVGSDWTKVSCPCCVSERVEPLVLVKLGEKVRPETKRWLIRVIGTPQKDGGEGSDNADELRSPAELTGPSASYRKSIECGRGLEAVEHLKHLAVTHLQYQYSYMNTLMYILIFKLPYSLHPHVVQLNVAS